MYMFICGSIFLFYSIILLGKEDHRSYIIAVVPVDAYALNLFFFRLLRILVSTSIENAIIFVVR